MIDIVFPDNNENEFIKLGKKLGFDKLIFVYNKIDEVKENGALLCKPNEINKARNKVKIVLVESSDKDRYVLERTKPNLIFNLEYQNRDFMHHRNSGLNQVLCKIAKKRNIAVGFNFNLVLNNEGMERSQILGRIMQNIRFCRKYKISTVLASFAKKPFEMRSYHDLISFGISLGMHPKEAKDSLRYMERKEKKEAVK